MKEKLELHHIAPYLPYGLKFISEMDKPKQEYGKNPIWTLSGVQMLFGDYCLCPSEISDAYPIHLCELILRPLSDLTKEIDHNGEKFVPINRLNENHLSASKLEYYESNFCRGSILLNSEVKGFNVLSFYKDYSNVFEWKFDVFGLIEKGLAIDINTLECKHLNIKIEDGLDECMDCGVANY